MNKQNTHKIRITLIIGFIFICSFFASNQIASRQVAQAQSLNEELNQVSNTVKETVKEVSQQLSGEENASSATGSQETIDEIKKRLEKTIDDTKIKGTSDDQTQGYGFVGEITRVSEEAVTVSHSSSTTIVPLKDVKIIKSKKEVELSELIVGNWVTVLGVREQSGTQASPLASAKSDQGFSPKFVVISSVSLQSKPKIVMLGSIASINTKSLSVLPRSGGEAQSFTIGKNSVFQNSNGAEVTQKQFEVDTNVLVVASTQVAEVEGAESTSTMTTVRSLVPLE
jgi:cytochrome oxidase Cu insertion factor (SCO1/SenC/PrrC family)